MAYALSTRSASEDPLFGHYLDQLPQNKLPLMTEIYKNFLFRRETEFQQLYVRHGKVIKRLDEDNFNKIVNDMVESLKHIWWSRASIPVREDKHIFSDLKKFVKEAKKCVKDSSIKTTDQIEAYLKRKGFDRILDISLCRYILIFCQKELKSLRFVVTDFFMCVFDHFSHYMTNFEFSGVLQEPNQLKKFNGTSANVKQNFPRKKSISMLNKDLLEKVQLVELISKAHKICKRKKQEI